MNEHTISTDVLVIGAGIAGILAAIKAREQGSDVILLTKESVKFVNMEPPGEESR